MEVPYIYIKKALIWQKTMMGILNIMYQLKNHWGIYVKP